MAEGRRYGLSTQLDIQQILLEAQNRWLRPPEICEILRNYHKFNIAPEPPNKPSSGSLYLFDRKVLRYFRKDGHNWRKKKDGKTVKEAHERLKAGSVDVLHCYYAHGEENEYFQRRSYWMLEEDLMHIVLVHYREVKGNKLNYGRTQDLDDTSHSTQSGCLYNSNIFIDNNLLPRTMDTSSRNTAYPSEFDDAESDKHQVSSKCHPFLDLQTSKGRHGIHDQMMDSALLKSYFPLPDAANQDDYTGKQFNNPRLNSVPPSGQNFTAMLDNPDLGLTSLGSRKQNGTESWSVLGNSSMQFQNAALGLPVSSCLPTNMMGLPHLENMAFGQDVIEDYKQEAVASLKDDLQWKIAPENNPSRVERPFDWKKQTDFSSDLSGGFTEKSGHDADVNYDPDSFSTNSVQGNSSFLLNEFQYDVSNAESESILRSSLDMEKEQVEEELCSYLSTRPPLIDSTTGHEALKKFDSFSKWMSKELAEVDGAHSGIYWNNTVESGHVIEDPSMSPQVHDAYLLSPSLSQDQLFSIVDFSPNWAHAGMETKVLIMGTLLKDKNDMKKCEWSCMFGEFEVPAEVLSEGVLRCCAPAHAVGRVPFYVTCSNRVACSEVREFEYRDQQRSMDVNKVDENSGEMLLRVRLGKLLSLDSFGHAIPSSESDGEKAHIMSKISSLLEENDDDWFQMEKLTTDDDFSLGEVKEQLLQKVLKDKLHVWLIHKVAEGGKGPNVLDKEGQGVLHLAAALGYDWAIAPTIAAGVNINFRDINGWTALHWAAFCGREHTVVTILGLGGAPGAVTDPCPEFPSGRTPADLAYVNWHKGIAGYLDESFLMDQLENLKLNPVKDGGTSEVPGVKSLQTVTEHDTQYVNGDMDELSLRHSLTAVSKVSQAAARIHQAFRVDSFQRKQLIEFGNDKLGMSDERALSLVSGKSNRSGKSNEPIYTAAIKIQNKFRSWKGRKEFLMLRQRIVKIQAHVRGFQVRKQYRKIIWSVGILEKVILRWRRKGSGLRGFRSEGPVEGQNKQIVSSKEDDYDFLKEGRKQTEARLEKALARVRSMVQYPEARNQYHRILNGVTEFQETKVVLEKLLNDSDAMDGDEMIEFADFLEDDTFMYTAS